MILAICSMSRRSRTPPVGFCGEFKMISRVRSLMSDGQFVDVEGEIAFFFQVDGNRATADVVDHRLVDGEAGVGIDDFIPFINERQDREENNWLAAGDDDDFVAALLSHCGCG